MNNRPVLIFLLLNFVVGTVILINFSSKSADKKITATPEVAVAQPGSVQVEKTVPATKSTPEPADEKIAKASDKTEKPKEARDASPAVCMEYGPMDIEEKSAFDSIVNREKIASMAHASKRPQFQIYWNLGTNQAAASEMFERQKKDALQDSKFQLTNDNGTWMVSIAIINDSLETAKAVAAQLGEKANKVNAGGKWQYKTLPDAYYYQVKNIAAMSPASLAQITTGLGLGKKPC